MKDNDFAKLVLFVSASVPAALLAWDAARGDLGANPAEYALHTTGNLAVIFLLLSLSTTPMRKLTGKNWWSLFRKSLGLFAFFYAFVHLSIYFVLYQSLDLRKLFAAMVSNKFIILGASAFLLLVPLAVTSTNGMIKRLGAAKWKLLHKLVYPAAILAVMHFWMSKKRDVTVPEVAAVVLAVLLGIRLIVWLRTPGKTPGKKETRGFPVVTR